MVTHSPSFARIRIPLIPSDVLYGLTARTCPHCGGVHLDIYETGPEEILLLDIYRAVNTIKGIIVFMFVLWVIGVIVITVQLSSTT